MVRGAYRRRLPKHHAQQVSGFALGVSPNYIRELRAAGLPRASADELMGLRALGVSGDFVRELTAAGMTDLSIDDVMELRAVGVTGSEPRVFGPRGDRRPPGPPPDPPGPPRAQRD